MTASQLHPYTTQLQAGLGLVDETRALLELWAPGMTTPALQQAALNSGQFPGITARRLRNIVVECFAPRYLADEARPAAMLKRLHGSLDSASLLQLLLLYTCRANPILADFVRTVYWPSYAAGAAVIDNESARRFVERAIDDGKMARRWSATTVRRVAAYLTGCCADFGLLEGGARTRRRIQRIRLSPRVVNLLAHDLHFHGVGDNTLLGHPDWVLFGLNRQDVLEEFRRLSLRNAWIVQAAGDTASIGWLHKTMESVCDVVAES
jgi:hypothetical protein